MEVYSMNYMSAQEAADKWGITKRRVQILCSENRIEGAEKMGNMWIIPKDANKPEDRRTKKREKEGLKMHQKLEDKFNVIHPTNKNATYSSIIKKGFL
jgi:hypothetical protein